MHVDPRLRLVLQKTIVLGSALALSTAVAGRAFANDDGSAPRAAPVVSELPSARTYAARGVEPISAEVTPTPNAPRSIPRRTTGEVLTILGITHLVTGTILLGYVAGQFSMTCPNHVDGFDIPPPCGPRSDAYFSLIAGIPIAITGVALTATGIPLWVSGARRAGSDGARAEDYAPRIAVGAGSVSITVPF